MKALRYSSLYKSMCTDVSVNTFVYRSEVDYKEYRKYIFLLHLLFYETTQPCYKGNPTPSSEGYRQTL